jgi:hypothetical protein
MIMAITTVPDTPMTTITAIASLSIPR